MRLQQPEILMQPCVRPDVDELNTNADLLRLLSKFMESFDVCAAKHNALVVAIQEN